MNKNPKPTRGMPRSLIFAMIPGGFLLIILILMFSGFWTQEETPTPTTIVPDPAEQTAPAAPTTSPAQTTPPGQAAPPAQTTPPAPTQ